MDAQGRILSSQNNPRGSSQAMINQNQQQIEIVDKDHWEKTAPLNPAGQVQQMARNSGNHPIAKSMNPSANQTM